MLLKKKEVRERWKEYVEDLHMTREKLEELNVEKEWEVDKKDK